MQSHDALWVLEANFLSHVTQFKWSIHKAMPPLPHPKDEMERKAMALLRPWLWHGIWPPCTMSTWTPEPFIFLEKCTVWEQILRYVGVVWLHFFWWTPILDWWVVRWILKNKHRKGTCLNEIGLVVKILFYWLLHTQLWTHLGGLANLNKDAFPILITKSREVWFLLILHHKFPNATQVCCVNLISWSWRTLKPNQQTLHNLVYLHLLGQALPSDDFLKVVP